jgi:aconitate hydratase
LDIVGLDALEPGRRVKVVLHHVDGSTDEIETTHTMSEEHIAWFKAGSALNLLAAQQAK